MAAFKDLLGPTLIANAFARMKKWDTVQTADVLKDKKVGLFFGASWCVHACEAETTKWVSCGEHVAQTHDLLLDSEIFRHAQGSAQQGARDHAPRSVPRSAGRAEEH